MNTLESYKHAVHRTMGNGDDRAWALGLAGESGEVVDLVKKLHYHGGFDKKGPITPDRILNECGDVLWYLVALLDSYGFSLHQCIDANVAKLQKRHPNGFTFETAREHRDENGSVQGSKGQ